MQPPSDLRSEMDSVNIDVYSAGELERIFKGYEKQAPSILAEAANRAATAVKTSVRKEIRSRYYVKSSDIRASENTRTASKGRPYAAIRYTGSHLNLMRWDNSHGHSIVSFSPRNAGLISTWSSGPAYYKARIKKGHSPVALHGGGGEIPFVQRSKSSGEAVMLRREGEKEYPLKGVAGPDYTQLVMNEDVRAIFTRRGREVMSERIIHGLKRVKA